MWIAFCYFSGCALAILLILYLISLRKRFSIRRKHVMITGGSSGIGKCVAAEALRRGAAKVTLIARNKTKLTAAKEELEKMVAGSNQSISTVGADVSVAKEVAEALSGMAEEVDVLVNCAGITHTATMLETPNEKYQELLGVNVLGSVFVTKAVLPSMVRRKSGAIVFISSQAGQLGLYGYTAYSTSKYSLRGLAETLQMELKPHNVQVSVSFPPDTDTPQLQAELLLRDAIQTNLAAFGTVFEAKQIAKEVWSGVERGVFQITHGLDGFLLGTVTAGVSPAHTVWDALTQIFLMGLFRAVSLVYQLLFNRVVARGLTKTNKAK